MTELYEHVLGYLIILSGCIITELCICFISTRGTIMDNEPRASMQYLLYVRLGKSASFELRSLFFNTFYLPCFTLMFGIPVPDLFFWKFFFKISTCLRVRFTSFKHFIAVLRGRRHDEMLKWQRSSERINHLINLQVANKFTVNFVKQTCAFAHKKSVNSHVIN